MRPLDPGDADALAAGIGNYNVVRWLAAPPYPYGVDDAAAFIAATLGQGDPVWAITDADGLRGVIGIDPELGFWLARDAWGQGYATEAGDAAIDAWFRGTRADRLQGSHFEGNDASARALRKMGFVDAGPRLVHSLPLRQDVRARAMLLTRDRWTARRSYRLRTRRLSLRELQDADWRALQRIGHAAPMSEAAAKSMLQAFRYRGRPGFLAAVRRWGRTIGFAGLQDTPGRAHPSLTWTFDPSLRGRGFGPEALGALLEDAFPRFELDAVEAERAAHDPERDEILRQLGFVQIGPDTRTDPAPLEPSPIVIYRLDRPNLKAPR
nr:GNAT family N-acetyltransferase [Palleronia pontilimi]